MQPPDGKSGRSPPPPPPLAPLSGREKHPPQLEPDACPPAQAGQARPQLLLPYLPLDGLPLARCCAASSRRCHGYACGRADLYGCECACAGAEANGAVRARRIWSVKQALKFAPAPPENRSSCVMWDQCFSWAFKLSSISEQNVLTSGSIKEKQKLNPECLESQLDEMCTLTHTRALELQGNRSIK